ncbi:MAG: GNAT family N-acetyltransferase [Anaerolineae bacterium]|nr:GNAT family N-acetyltransferase [Anaerolineae bacterium]
MLYGLLVDLEPLSSEFYDEKMYVYWNNETAVTATMGSPNLVSRAEIERIQEHRRGGRERGYTGVHFMIRARDGSVIGTMGLNWVDEWHRTANLGAWIGEPDYIGGGHGQDGLLLLIDYAFDWLDLRRLDLMTMGINMAAQGAVERCGFIFEARRRHGTLVNGQRADTLQYGMLREEWPGRAVMVERLNLRARAEKRYPDYFGNGSKGD